MPTEPPRDDAPTVRALLVEGRAALRTSAAAEATPREATLLLGHLLARSEAQLLAHDDDRVAPADADRFRGLVARRVAGEPVAYLLGRRELWGRDFAVDRRVLVPRPETEHLIAAVLALPLPPRPRILDVGVGSGAIAVTLAAELPEARVVATDLDPGALAVARLNARRHGVEARLSLLRTDLARGLDLATFDVLASNPPYVDPAVAPTLSPAVRDFEPPGALFAADAGRAVLARLLLAASALRRSAWAVFEIGYDQGDWIVEEAAKRGDLQPLEVVRDYAGHPRTAVFERL